MATHIEMVGNGYAGDSGTHTFLANGDVGGSGYDVCTFHHVPTYGEYFNCDRGWNAAGGIHDVDVGRSYCQDWLLERRYRTDCRLRWRIRGSLPDRSGTSQHNRLQQRCTVRNGIRRLRLRLHNGRNRSSDTSRCWSVGSSRSRMLWGFSWVQTPSSQQQGSLRSPTLAPALRLSDENYPGFFRVVPSDAFQGAVVADVMSADGQDNVAVVHMTNAYGAGLADAFVQT